MTQGEDGQREKPHKKSPLSTLWSWTSSFQNSEKIIPVVSGPQSGELCFGSPSKLIHDLWLGYGSATHHCGVRSNHSITSHCLLGLTTRTSQKHFKNFTYASASSCLNQKHGHCSRPYLSPMSNLLSPSLTPVSPQVVLSDFLPQGFLHSSKNLLSSQELTSLEATNQRDRRE